MSLLPSFFYTAPKWPKHIFFELNSKLSSYLNVCVIHLPTSQDFLKCDDGAGNIITQELKQKTEDLGALQHRASHHQQQRCCLQYL